MRTFALVLLAFTLFNARSAQATSQTTGKGTGRPAPPRSEHMDRLLMQMHGNAGNKIANMFLEKAVHGYNGGTAASRLVGYRGPHRTFETPHKDGSLVVMFHDNSGVHIHSDGYITPMGDDISHEVKHLTESGAPARVSVAPPASPSRAAKPRAKSVAKAPVQKEEHLPMKVGVFRDETPAAVINTRLKALEHNQLKPGMTIAVKEDDVRGEVDLAPRWHAYNREVNAGHIGDDTAEGQRVFAKHFGDLGYGFQDWRTVRDKIQVSDGEPEVFTRHVPAHTVADESYRLTERLLDRSRRMPEYGKKLAEVRRSDSAMRAFLAEPPERSGPYAPSDRDHLRIDLQALLDAP